MGASYCLGAASTSQCGEVREARFLWGRGPNWVEEREILGGSGSASDSVVGKFQVILSPFHFLEYGVGDVRAAIGRCEKRILFLSFQTMNMRTHLDLFRWGRTHRRMC